MSFVRKLGDKFDEGKFIDRIMELHEQRSPFHLLNVTIDCYLDEELAGAGREVREAFAHHFRSLSGDHPSHGENMDELETSYLRSLARKAQGKSVDEGQLRALDLKLRDRFDAFRGHFSNVLRQHDPTEDLSPLKHRLTHGDMNALYARMLHDHIQPDNLAEILVMDPEGYSMALREIVRMAALEQGLHVDFGPGGPKT